MRFKLTHKRLSPALSSFLISCLLRICWVWTRKELRLTPAVEGLLRNANPAVFCYWHQYTLIGIWALLQLLRRGCRIAVLVSPSRDGDMATRMLATLGIDAVRGSETRTGMQALRDMYMLIKDQRTSIAVAPDGPRGPAREFKLGTLLLARTAQADVVPLQIRVNKCWKLNSWDRLCIPKPFARAMVEFRPPVRIPTEVPASQLSRFTDLLTEQLDDVH